MAEFIDLARMPGLLLIVARLAGFFMMTPFFSYRNIPMPVRIGLVMFLAWIMYFTIEIPVFFLNGQFFLLLVKEVTVGLMIGLLAYIILSAIQIAGGFIDFQMGFAIANIVDPQTGAQSPIIGQYLYIFALLFLVATNAHHLLIDGIFYSYEFIGFYDMIPIGDQSFPIFILDSFAHMFMLAFQMSIPVVGSLFLVDIALGMIARTVPQVNVFVVGLPLKIFVAFVMILIFLGFYVMLLRGLFETMFQMMRQLMQLMGGA
ncbi:MULTISPECIES: flagellar biosynthetic protein FliR [Allobacillus]|uniref:Flagellar biosynthetic protein FliR n=1 Tax=Allobacillus halotolerans TaxID=570278 RepID=A0ABS6GQX4_9BACI|nr:MULTISPECIES: flagellar biosynthetic protein FliR [Allobacillus]MBU6081050.1 flagellar type III secretion system protein FliR [Allobacillus halotolerans]TSJ69213.1 flagellar type III secretion system protein FliR [Allobacillus sp. SKP2-8]